MTTAADRGWPVRELAASELALVSTPTPTAAQLAEGVLAVPGLPLRVRKEVVVPFRVLVKRLQQLRADSGLSPLTSSGGYNFRPVRGYEAKWAATKNPTYLSNHSWGLAVDLNAATNPMGKPLRTDFPAAARQIAAECGLTSGAEWSRPDPMHFEALLTPAQAAAWAAKLSTPTTSEEDELSEVADLVREMHDEIMKRIPNRVDGKSEDTALGYAANADAHSWEVRQALLTPQPSRVAGSDVTLTPLDAAMNADAGVFRLEQRVTGLDAGLSALAKLVAANVVGLTADQILSTVRQAIEDAVVKVDVSVNGKDS